jgi:hypothetical protein
MEIKVYFVWAFEWFKRLRQKHEDFKDDRKSGRPQSAQNTETVAKVHELVTTDHKMYLELMEVQLHNNQEMVCQLLPEGMAKPQ